MMTKDQQIDEVFYVVKEHSTVGRFFVCGKSQKRSIVRNRALVADMLHNVIGLTLKETGLAIGGKAHSTISDLIARHRLKPEHNRDVGVLTETLTFRIYAENYQPTESGATHA